jgi:hypothetical protein
MYGITLHLDHLEASKLFLLSWILRWKPDLAKTLGDNLAGSHVLDCQPAFKQR